MSEIMEQYHNLRRYLGIDVLDIEGQFNSIPRIMETAGELAARAIRNRTLAKYNIQIAEANAAANIRLVPMNGKAPSQAAIDSMLPLDVEVQAAVKAYGDAEDEANACDGLHEALKGQWIMMHKVSDLTMTGYFNPGVLPDRPSREPLRYAREEADIKRAEQIRPPRPRPTGSYDPYKPRTDTIRARFNRPPEDK